MGRGDGGTRHIVGLLRTAWVVGTKQVYPSRLLDCAFGGQTPTAHVESAPGARKTSANDSRLPIRRVDASL
ncbi:MAG: hypothetical protein F6Q13_02085 [Mycobacterium sp.]|nr:MAG: hypothetical protein F6Q13_02085 [Mycobacterium sp.]